MAKFKSNYVEIIPPKSIFVGSEDAPITLTMYGDYEDEACAKANEVVKKLVVEFKGKLRFSFRHFPQTKIHQKAMKAAEASLAAAQEGKYSWHVRDDQIAAWEMGIRTIPVFLINGERFAGSPTYDNLKKEIQIKLKKASKKRA